MGYRLSMAKGNKQEGSRSVLKLAYEAFERGDAVQARQLAQAVLAGRIGRDDEKVALELAKEMEIDGAWSATARTPGGVARQLISRTITPGRPYLFVALVAVVFIGLVLLARYRY